MAFDAPHTADLINGHPKLNPLYDPTHVKEPDPANDKMVGVYPEDWRDHYKGTRVAVCGGGEAYREMLGKALKFLGAKVFLYDPDPNAQLLNGETRIDGHSTVMDWSVAGLPPGIPVFIESPNKLHYQQAKYLV